MTKDKPTIRICHLYPEDMNIYGDLGNIITLRKRLEWRGYGVVVDEVNVGQDYDFKGADILMAGGGQDRGQLLVADDLQAKSEALHAAYQDDLPMLLICGSYQLFGNYFQTIEDTRIPGIGIFDAVTTATDRRLIGNVVIDSVFGKIVGFENHSGATVLADGVEALGKVEKGHGNDGASGHEGAISRNCIGTYLHGPVLVKNPVLADSIISRALKRSYDIVELERLDDELELATASQAASRPQ